MQQYTSKQKTLIILILGALAALGPFSIDMYLPAFPAIAGDMGVETSKVGLSLTSYFIGISLGQFIYGPLIDRYGRKKPILIGLSLYLVASILCFLSFEVEHLIVARFIQALGGCVGMVASRAIIKDVFKPEEIAKTFSMIALVMGVAPIIAPTVGGLIVAALSWKAVFITLAILAAIVFLLVFIRLPETRGADPSVSMKPKDVVSNYFAALKIEGFIAYTLAGSFSMATMFAYIAGSPFVFMKLRGMTESQYAWIFGLNALGILLGSQFNRLALNRYSSEQICRACVLTILATTSVLLIGNSMFDMHIYLIQACLFLTLFALGFINPNTTALALNKCSPRNAGTASAIMGAIQMMSGAAMTGFVSVLHNGTSVPMMAGMFTAALLGTAFMFIALRSAKASRKNIPA